MDDSPELAALRAKAEQFNRQTIGICLIGDGERRPFTDAQVARLADQIRSDHGHIDVLVNDIWGGELLKGGPPQWNTPIWELDLEDGLRILRLAIDTHLITSHHLLPLDPARMDWLAQVDLIAQRSMIFRQGSVDR